MNNIGINNKRNQEMASKMADLNTNYESAQMKLDTQNKILEMTKRSLEEYINKYERERENNRKMQTELALLKGQSDQVENYKKQLEDYKINEIKLEEELNQLRVSPFIKQAEERGNVYRNLQICQKKLTETKKNLDENEKKLTQDFYNEITLSNLTLEGNIVQENNAKAAKKLDKKTLADIGTTPPPSNLPYSLICTIDTTEAPRHILEPDFLKNLGWNIRVFSTDTLGFCQDTSKEDKEKEIIASWEEKEPGRAELAKKSRKRFLLQKKAENGKKLTEEEANFLKEERVRKSFYKKEEEEKDDDKNKGKKKTRKS